jgi:hypothetical protein
MRIVHVLTLPENVFDRSGRMSVLWSAICMDFFLATQGDTREDAIDTFYQLILGYGVMNYEFGRDLLLEIAETPSDLKIAYRNAAPENRHTLDIEPLLQVRPA